MDHLFYDKLDATTTKTWEHLKEKSSIDSTYLMHNLSFVPLIQEIGLSASHMSGEPFILSASRIYIVNGQKPGSQQ